MTHSLAAKLLLIALLADFGHPLSLQESVIDVAYSHDVYRYPTPLHFNLLCSPLSPFQPTLDGVGANMALILLFVMGVLGRILLILEYKCYHFCKAVINRACDPVSSWLSFPQLFKKALSLLLMLFAAGVVGMLLIMSGDVEQNPGPPKQYAGLDKKPKILELSEVVKRTAPRWMELAYALYFEHPVVAAIRLDSTTVKERCTNMLGKWLDGEGEREPRTWHTLLEALRDIRHTVLANELTETLLQEEDTQGIQQDSPQPVVPSSQIQQDSPQPVVSPSQIQQDSPQPVVPPSQIQQDSPQPVVPPSQIQQDSPQPVVPPSQIQQDSQQPVVPPSPGPPLYGSNRKGVTAAELLCYHHEPVEPDAKFPEDEKKIIIQYAGLHANCSYFLLATCTYQGAPTIRYLSFKPCSRLNLFGNPLIKPRNEDKCTPWEFTSPSDGNFTLHCQDQSGTWYFAITGVELYPDKDSRHAALLGFQPVSNGAKNEFHVYHHDQTRNQKIYLVMSSDGVSITLSESSEASRWQVVPHDPKNGTHGVECYLYINTSEDDRTIQDHPNMAGTKDGEVIVRYTMGFNEDIQTTDLCEWEKAKESTHSGGVSAGIGAAFNLLSIALQANYQHSRTTREAQRKQHKFVKGHHKQESMQQESKLPIGPGEEAYQTYLVADLYQTWSVKKTGQPFFIEKENSIENRTATIDVRKI